MSLDDILINPFVSTQSLNIGNKKNEIIKWYVNITNS